MIEDLCYKVGGSGFNFSWREVLDMELGAILKRHKRLIELRKQEADAQKRKKRR